MLDGYLEFFMKPALAETYLSLKGELDELVHQKVISFLFWNFIFYFSSPLYSTFLNPPSLEGCCCPLLNLSFLSAAFESEVGYGATQ